VPPRQSRRRKAEAVVLADALNSADEAGKRLGIPGRSIRRWRDDPELAELVLKTREETADDVKVAMVLTWERIIQRLKADEIETKDLIVLGGVAFDKHQLATGGATARTEARDITGTLSDVELDAAIREAEELVRRTASAEEGPGEGGETG
jgi:hypothetical protein